MDISECVKTGEIVISPQNPLVEYSGRIGYDEDGDAQLVFPCSYVKFHFRGTGAAIVVSSKKYYFNVYAGCIVDGQQACIELPEDGTTRISFGDNLIDTDHVITFFKRQDACNMLTIHGIILAEGSELRPCAEKPQRRIEVYGDSVSAGEVSEAVTCIGAPDPEGHEGCYSNSWHSYSWITARKLKAELHDIAQGGIALMPGTGWFDNYTGLEEIYDKVRYYPDKQNATEWDFSKYIPHVVIVAVGQNDANPENFMKEDYQGTKSVEWRRRYGEFLKKLRGHYPDAFIICTTTILNHDRSWDKAIDEVVGSLGGMRSPEFTSGECTDTTEKLAHFMYRLNGSGTPGHIRIPEAEMMAQELAAFIESLKPWPDSNKE